MDPNEMTLAAALLRTIPASRNQRVRESQDIDMTPCARCGARGHEIGRVALRVGGMPCPDCCDRANARAAAYDWTKDPAFGTCDNCSTLLFINAKGELEPCECSGGAAIESEYEYARRARIPTKYRDARIGNWEPQDGHARQVVAEYAFRWPPAYPFLVLDGSTGTGKTHLAIGALFDAHRRHGAAAVGRFWPVVDLMDRYRRASDPDRAQESIEQIEASLDRVRLLVLDDVGAQRATGFAEERLYGLVDHRLNEGMATIFTTNEVPANFEPRLRSRMYSGRYVQVVAPDHRMS